MMKEALAVKPISVMFAGCSKASLPRILHLSTLQLRKETLTHLNCMCGQSEKYKATTLINITMAVKLISVEFRGMLERKRAKDPSLYPRLQLRTETLTHLYCKCGQREKCKATTLINITTMTHKLWL